MANEHMKRWSVFLIMKIQKKKKSVVPLLECLLKL